jgi:hypothetical protein
MQARRLTTLTQSHDDAAPAERPLPVRTGAGVVGAGIVDDDVDMDIPGIDIPEVVGAETDGGAIVGVTTPGVDTCPEVDAGCGILLAASTAAGVLAVASAIARHTIAPMSATWYEVSSLHRRMVGVFIGSGSKKSSDATNHAAAAVNRVTCAIVERCAPQPQSETTMTTLTSTFATATSPWRRRAVPSPRKQLAAVAR